jgi:purine-binding chemotaxis protein CheW
MKMTETTQVCTFFLADQMFGLEVESVQEVNRFQDMTGVPLAPDAVCGLINLRGQIVTAIDLRKRLGMQERSADQLAMNVVIRSEDSVVSLLVDQIGDVQEIDSEFSELPPETIAGPSRELIRTAYKMKDRLLILLNTERVMNIS